MALNGTREGLYNAGMALCPEDKNGQRPVVLMPNPFYQVYMVAAISAGAEPVLIPATAATGHLPDYASVDPSVLNRTVACFMCSPGQSAGCGGAARPIGQDLIALAEQYDFQIFADECYSEIYRDTPPVGMRGVALKGADPERAVAFHIRSPSGPTCRGCDPGFIAGGPDTLRQAKQLRTMRAHRCRRRCNTQRRWSGQTRRMW